MPSQAGPTRPRVLLIEDDETIRESVAGSLSDSGFSVLAQEDGDQLERALHDFRPGAVVLDWMLPGRNGPALAKVVNRTSAVPVIMLTARDAVSDRLAGFEAGVDDYLVKPFAMEELTARLRVLLRRSGSLAATVQVGDLIMDPASATVLRDGESIDLTATEWRVLSYLADNHGRIVSTTQILTQVWGYDDYADNLVQVHISALRRKLEAHGPRLIHTVRGLGYVLRDSPR